MKKVILFSCLAFMFALFSMKAQAITAPVDARGDSLATIDYAGCQTASIDSSTGTALVVLNSTGSPAVSTGRAIVYGVITSSISQNDYLVLKDTTGANGTSGALSSQNSLQMVGTTVAVIGNFYQLSLSSYNTMVPYPVLNLIKFPVPLQFRYGIVGVASAAPISNNGVSRWTILYRKMDQSDR